MCGSVSSGELRDVMAEIWSTQILMTYVSECHGLNMAYRMLTVCDENQTDIKVKENVMNVNLFQPISLGNNHTVVSLNPDRFSSPLSNSWGVLIGLTILAIIVTGICLNSLILWTLIRLTGSKRRHSNTDYYIMALATSDLLVLILCYPFTFVSTVSRQWLFGELGCAIHGFLGFLFSVIDIGVLTMMSVLRLLCVKTPHSAFIKTPGYTVISLICVVAYALGWTIPPLLGWGHFAPEPFGTSCTVDWKYLDRSYVTSVFLCVLALPLLVMVVCYSTIVYHMRVTSAKMGECVTGGGRRSRRQNRLVRVAVLMCVCFMVIWTPYAVLSICFSYIPKFEVSALQSAIPTVLAKLSHVANPVISFTLNQSYRRRIKYWCLESCISKFSDLQTSQTCRNSQDKPAGDTAGRASQRHARGFTSPDPSLSTNLNATSFVMSLRAVVNPKRVHKNTTAVFVHLHPDHDENNQKKDISQASDHEDTISYGTDYIHLFQLNNETHFTEISNDDKSACAGSVVYSCAMPQEKTSNLGNGEDEVTYTDDVLLIIQNEHINTIL